MKWRIPTTIDRVGAIAIAIGVQITVALDSGMNDWSNAPLLAGALIYSALLAISTWWSLFLFALYSVPATLVAFIWCDGSAGAGPFGIVHLFHDLTIPLFLYGLVRGVWEVVVATNLEARRETPSS